MSLNVEVFSAVATLHRDGLLSFTQTASFSVR